LGPPTGLSHFDKSKFLLWFFDLAFGDYTNLAIHVFVRIFSLAGPAVLYGSFKPLIPNSYHISLSLYNLLFGWLQLGRPSTIIYFCLFDDRGWSLT
jgi:hypothetical protein